MFKLLLQSADLPNFSIVPHVVEDETLAAIVLADLNARYPEAQVKFSEIEIESLHLDQGGSIMARWEMIQAGPFRYWPHQIDAVLFGLNKALQDVRIVDNVRFCKVPNLHMMVCAYEKTVQSARQEIVDNLNALRAASQKDLEDWESAVASLGAHPNIQTPKKQSADIKN